MKSLLILVYVLFVGWNEHNVIAFNLPGPRVYVVTPSPRPLQIDEGRSVPFYYHKWMRRMDNDNSAQNITITAMPKVETPDLIFAEFESDSNESIKKSIRKLLEKERVVPKTMTTSTTTTFRPIYVPDVTDVPEVNKVAGVVDYGLPINVEEEEKVEAKPSDTIDYFSMYNKLYENLPPPVFLPSTTQTTTTTTTIPDSNKIENIWHIIDSERVNQYSGNWDEVPVETDKDTPKVEETLTDDEGKITQHKGDEDKGDEDEIDENIALPGLGANPGNGGENESRAIRTDQNIRFPYVNLKTFQLKPNRKPLDKKTNLMSSLDNFQDLKNPVRGEAQDVLPGRDNIDRYNSAQRYFPSKNYDSKVSKQNSLSPPPKATANLVPPPPPPAPKISNSDFPFLTNYEPFPPYDTPSLDSRPSPAPPRSPPPPPPPPPPSPQNPSIQMFSPPAVDSSDDFDSTVDSDDLPNTGPPMNVGYQYKPPSPPVQQFIPTLPPVSKPFNGYSYDRPPMPDESPTILNTDDNDFHGYHHSKPESAPPTNDPVAPSYGHHDVPPSYGHDYPELIFQKHHGDMDDSKGSDDMKGMVPPPPPDIKPFEHAAPMDDHGFPSDFPDDFKYHHDFDDHFYHHHHHPTTTTTEMPRVNRYSYYYLGKKLYYLPLYFSVYFIVYVGALVIKAILRHKIVYPNSWRPNDMTATFFSKRSVDAYLSNDNLHEVTGKVTNAIATAAEKYISTKSRNL